MSTRHEHYVEAERILDDVIDLLDDESMTDKARGKAARIAIAHAQVHATLATVGLPWTPTKERELSDDEVPAIITTLERTVP